MRIVSGKIHSQTAFDLLALTSFESELKVFNRNGDRENSHGTNWKRTKAKVVEKLSTIENGTENTTVARTA